MPSASWNIESITQHIEEVHHTSEREHMVALCRLIETLVRANGNATKDLGQARRLLYDLREELEMHMLKCERVLFPRFRNLDGPNRRSTSDPTWQASAGNIKIEQTRCLKLLKDMNAIVEKGAIVSTGPDYIDFCRRFNLLRNDIVKHFEKETGILLRLVSEHSHSAS